MGTKYHRRCLAGLGSHLVVSCVTLSEVNPPGPVVLSFDLANYDCQWADLFDYENTSCRHNVDIIPVYLKLDVFNLPTYPNESFAKWNRAYFKYIRPKQFIMDKVSTLLSKYQIEEATCVYFRGTDKDKECDRVDYPAYLEQLPSEGPLWIQSDELEFINYMKEKYPERTFSIDEFRYSSKDSPIHFPGTINDAVEILVIINLMSKAKYILGNISNVVRAALIIRGNGDNYTCVN